MSAGLDVDFFGDKGGEITRQCAVISIYEDLGARNMLLKLCNSLVWKFKDEVDFKVDWCRFKYLADPEIAMEAGQQAVQADLILLAPQSTELPVYVQGWFEGWLPNREAASGALVLVPLLPNGAAPSLPLLSYLRRTAKRARLDYFSMPQHDLIDLPGDDDRPLRWGINE